MAALVENVIPAPVQLTEGAVAQLQEIIKQENIAPENGLRIGVKGGGCSGFTYVLGFDKEEEGDDTYQINGMKVFMNKAHAIYLLGMEIDYQTGLNNRGFIFKNPNAKETCGCGTSFSA